MQILATLFVLLLQIEDRPELTFNYIIIAILLVIAAILSIVVVRRRIRERDDDWEN
jgi:Na+/melibiose symporter-like transporter